MAWDLSTWTKPVDATNPSGLELAEVRLRTGSEEEQTGASVLEAMQGLIEAHVPDLSPERALSPTSDFQPFGEQVLELGEVLFASTRHLGAAVCVVAALQELKGLAGLCEGLEALEALVRERWPDVQPGPSAVGDKLNKRVRVLQRLSTSFKDSGRFGFLYRFAFVPLLGADGPALRLVDLMRGDGSFPVRTSTGQTEDAARADCLSSAEQARRSASVDRLADAVRLLARCDKACDGIAGVFKANPLAGAPLVVPDLGELQRLLRRARTFLEGGAVASGQAAGLEAQASGGAGATTANARFDWKSVRVQSDDEARAALDAVRLYVSVRDRSNPLPVVLNYGRMLIGLGYEELEKVFPFSTYTVIQENIKRAKEGT
jgi:predicted component of type VI protein secretion system